jgi:WD40 repeat protein
VILWRLPDPPPAEKVGKVRRFVGHQEAVNGVALSPDGRYDLSTGCDGSIRLWDIQTGIEVRSYSGHTNNTRRMVPS